MLVTYAVYCFKTTCFRATNIKWCAVSVPESIRELWEQCAEDLTPKGIHTNEMVSCRKGQWNEAKRARQDALRKTAFPKEVAESNVYDEMLQMYNDHKVIQSSLKQTGYKLYF